MKKNQLIFFLGIFLLLFSAPSFSQKKVLTDEEEVTEMVTKEMDELFQSKDFLKQKDKKFFSGKRCSLLILNNAHLYIMSGIKVGYSSHGTWKSWHPARRCRCMYHQHGLWLQVYLLHIHSFCR